MIELHKQPNENEEQYIWRLCRAKESGELEMEWTELAKVLNGELRIDESEYRDESAYRKPFQQALRFYEAGVFKDLTSEAYAQMLREEQQALTKAKQKLSDERTEYQRLLREQARRESFIDLIKDVMQRGVERLEYRPAVQVENESGDSDMVVCLSDLHAGLEVNSMFNTFNSAVLKERLVRYLDEITRIQEMRKCKECHLILGGDMISGWIHSNLRLENNENVIEQVKMVSTLVGDFVRELQGLFEVVHVYSVSGNHSRLSPQKESQLKGEELDALIPFYLKLMFELNPSVKLHENAIDDTIIAFRTRGGKLFYGVHGDKDGTSTVVKNLTLMTGIKPDVVVLGHRHHNALSTEHGVKIVQCGSVIGMDNYCIDHRISGVPEQCVLITNERNAVECYHNVLLG